MSLDDTMQALLLRLDELTRARILWIAVSALLLIAVLCTLVFVIRVKIRNRKVEAWLVREMGALSDRILETQRLLAQGPQSQPPPMRAPAGGRPRPQPIRTPAVQPRDPRPEPVREAPVETSAPPTPPPEAAPVPPAPQAGEPLDVLTSLNEMLSGDQPYNFIEAIRAMDPGLTLSRLTPGAGGDIFSRRVYLEPGGDGLFAVIQGDTALLYPNYSRFSATLDPKPLFDGARHGARIHTIVKPARLKRQPEDDSWQLTHKGSVQMRQGT